VAGRAPVSRVLWEEIAKKRRTDKESGGRMSQELIWLIFGVRNLVILRMLESPGDKYRESGNSYEDRPREFWFPLLSLLAISKSC